MERTISKDSQAISVAQDTSEISAAPPQIADKDEGQAETITRVVSEQPYSVFSHGTKLFIVFMVAGAALMSAFAATLYYPALNVLATKLDVSDSLITISVTTYMIAQAIAPAFIGGLSDQAGRRLAFIICFLIYSVANVGLALQTNYAALLVLRCLQASGSSPTIALCIATTADVATSAERGKFMGYATGGILIGPAIGPLIGGVLAQFLGWRAIFWFLLIFGAVFGVSFAIFVPETSRAVVGNGSIPAKGVNMSVLGYLERRKRASDVESQVSSVRQKKKFEWPNPLLTLKILGEKESAFLLIYNGLFFNGWMIFSIVLPYVLKTRYGYNELEIGLCYLPGGVGSLIAAVGAGRLVDWRFRVHARRMGMEIKQGKQQDLTNFPIEQCRVDVVWPSHIIGTSAFITFGWLVHHKVHIAGPLIMSFFIAFGISSAFNTSNTLLVDLHRGKPATATAAVNFVRCLISAGGVAAIVPMVQAMGAGWCFTFWGLVFVAIMPMLWILVRLGPKWRAELAEKKARQAKEKELAAVEREAVEVEEETRSADRVEPEEKQIESACAK